MVLFLLKKLLNSYRREKTINKGPDGTCFCRTESK